MTQEALVALLLITVPVGTIAILLTLPALAAAVLTASVRGVLRISGLLIVLLAATTICAALLVALPATHTVFV